MADMAHDDEGNAKGSCAYRRHRRAGHCRDGAEAIMTVEKHNLTVICDDGALRQRVDLVLINLIEVLWKAPNTVGVDAGKTAPNQVLRHLAGVQLRHAPSLKQLGAHSL
jgi:hypothetical protein